MSWPTYQEIMGIAQQFCSDCEPVSWSDVQRAIDWAEEQTRISSVAPTFGWERVEVKGRWGHLPRLLKNAEQVQDEDGRLLSNKEYTFSPWGAGPYSRILLKTADRPGALIITGTWGAFDKVPAWFRRAVLVKCVGDLLQDHGQEESAARYLREAEDLCLLHRRIAVWASNETGSTVIGNAREVGR